MPSSPPPGGMASRQPVKALYVIILTLLNAAKFPWWLVRFIPRAYRQNPSFSYKQAIGTEIVRNWLDVVSVIRIYTPLRLEPGPGVRDKKRYVRLDPSKAKTATKEGGAYTGIVSVNPDIKPATVFGIWYPSCPTQNSLERLQVDEKAPPLILHFHGGAFIIGDPRPAYSGYLGSHLAGLGPTLAVSYRLASNPKGAFPAQLQDAITAYSYVVSTLGVPARRVVLSGDSAGGNVVMALLRYIERYPEAGLENPGGAMLWSPWLDVSGAIDAQRIYESPNCQTDYLVPSFVAWGSSHFSHGSDEAAKKLKEAAVDGPWISPALHPFHTKTPIWAMASAMEVLYHDIEKFVPDMQAIKGNDVEWHVEPVGNHDIVLVGNLTGFEREAKRSVEAAKTWLSAKVQQ